MTTESLPTKDEESTEPNDQQLATTTPHPSRRFKISGDAVNQATANLEEHPRSIIRWLHSYMVGQDIIPEEMGTMLKKESGGTYSGDSVYQLITGRRTAGIEPMVEAIARFKELEDSRATITRAPFVRTKLATRIWDVCQGALIYQKVCFIIGPSQIGKTTAFVEYQRQHNHGETTYVEMPSGGNMGDFLVALAEALRISPHLSTRELRRRIKRSFDSRMLLIVDQAHEPFENERSHRLPLPLKFVMEIHNATKCGVVLGGTDVLEKGIKEGEHKKIMRQLELRSLAWQKLPARPSKRNLDEFAASYSLSPAEGKPLALQDLIITDHGLGRWCTILQAASRFAEKDRKAAGRKTPMTWSHVLKAHAALVALETPRETDDQE